MPNGTELSRAEFLFLDRAMENIDAAVQSFAARVHGGITREYHSYPCRRIESRDVHGLSKAIIISPVTVGAGATKSDPQYLLSIWVNGETKNGFVWWAKEIRRFTIGQMESAGISRSFDDAWDQLSPLGLEFLVINGTKR
jgi:hypothetical protein